MRVSRLQAGLIGLAVAIVSGWASYTAVMKGFGLEPPITKNARFSCGLRPDPEDRNLEVWTLNYHKGGRAGYEPWLRMVQEMEDGWTPDKRCAEMEVRMNRFASDRLLKIDYRRDPSLPQQYVLCGITERAPESCDLLITLSVADSQEPERVLKDVVRGLKTEDSIRQSRRGGQLIPEWTIEVQNLFESSRVLLPVACLAVVLGLTSSPA